MIERYPFEIDDTKTWNLFKEIPFVSFRII